MKVVRRAHIDGVQRFVKTGSAARADAFAAEADGLQALRQAGLRVPEVVSKSSVRLRQGHRPQASLLHGDLWRGNAAFSAGEPVVFDPAVYYGDRESDLAMTELFGGFPREFYGAYNDILPLPREYGIRKHLYNLYHLLNHLNLFGGGYLGQVQQTLRLLLGFLD